MASRRVNRAVGAAEAGTQLHRVALPCAIRVVDEEQREIELCATSEAVDSYGTVFSYEASRDAFTRWIGNVREMHERRAVGTRVAVRCDDGERRIYVRLRVSKGAEDTWEKVKDGTLRGASIGASNVEWVKQARRVAGQERVLDVATRYDLVELSLVDNPSNPDALGVTFVRDGVPADDVLEEVAEPVEEREAAEGDHQGGVTAPRSAAIIEDAGSLSAEDTAARIAELALERGRAAIAAGGEPSAAPESNAKQRKLAALGAPGYVRFGETAGEQDQAGASESAAESGGDGQVVERAAGSAGTAMASAAGSVAHRVHDHHHTGQYDDPSNHREASAHIHLDGTQHEHEHVMDHRHGDHSGYPQGHTHPHGHVPDHEHYYRVADGSAIAARLVTVEQVRTWEYVSAAAFRAAGGVEGKGLSVPQFRSAQAYELRSLGPYSRNPEGPADAGTPAQVAEAPTSADVETGAGNGGIAALSAVNLDEALRRIESLLLTFGGVRALDRDGQPVAGADANGCVQGESDTTGTLDVSKAPDGWDGRNTEASVTRVVKGEVERVVGGLVGQLEGTLRTIEQRLARIESQPQPGGPVLRAADRGTALAPVQSGQGGVNEQYRALESLAGKLTDPQAQVAVAAEMIRLQQEAAGLGPAYQVMPRAGHGVGR